MNESLEIVNHIYKDSEMAISTLTKLSTTLEKKDNKIKDTVEDIIKGYERYFKDAKKICLLYTSLGIVLLVIQHFINKQVNKEVVPF